MGDCKNNMKPTTEKAKSLLDKIKSIRAKKDIPDPESTALTLVDQIAEVYETLEKLIDIKQADLRAEKGQEPKNKLALSRLETMQILIERVIDKAEEYAKQ